MLELEYELDKFSKENKFDNLQKSTSSNKKVHSLHDEINRLNYKY
jgi:hypothetical protein